MTQTPDITATPPRFWTGYAALTLLAAVGVSVLFYGTVADMVAIWLRSETYTHGFIIAPISLWLIWEKRAELAQLRPEPDLRVLALSLPVGLGWLMGDLVDALVVQQFAFVAMLIVVLWAMLGSRVSWHMAFPLAFLFFAVPAGEGLLYPLMEFTTDFTVAMLQLTGIPVYREGNFFSIPSGDWSVVEACSGLRYLIASVTLGVLYAYLTYTKLWKRLIFVAFAIIVPLFANGMRAYFIVMIAHLSDMKLAMGVDHFVYGWVWFGIVIIIMFAIGAIWRDPVPPRSPQAPAQALGNGGIGTPMKALIPCLLAAGIWPVLASTMQQQETPLAGQARIQAPAGVDGWRLTDVAAWDWEPQITNPDGRLQAFYTKDGMTVGLYLGVFLTQRQGAELVNSQNYMVAEGHGSWMEMGLFHVPMTLGETDVKVRQTKLDGGTMHLLSRHWYRVGSRYTANDYLAKLLEGVSRLLGLRKDGSFMVIATTYNVRMSEAEPILQAFTDAMLPDIERALDAAAGEG